MLAVRVAQRVNDCLVIVGNEVEGCFASIETMYTDMLREYNAAQKDGDAVQYQPLVFDIDPKERCELCFHASADDRPLGIHVGKKYHPECANMWITCVDKTIPVFISKEDSFYSPACLKPRFPLTPKVGAISETVSTISSLSKRGIVCHRTGLSLHSLIA